MQHQSLWLSIGKQRKYWQQMVYFKVVCKMLLKTMIVSKRENTENDVEWTKAQEES